MPAGQLWLFDPPKPPCPRLLQLTGMPTIRPVSSQSRQLLRPIKTAAQNPLRTCLVLKRRSHLLDGLRFPDIILLMRTLLVLLLGACVTLQTQAETEREFFSHLVDALPKAAPGEFKTPESVARYFVQAIIDNRVQDTFRCIPLNQMYAADTFEKTENYIGNTFNARDGLPDDDYGRYLRLISGSHYLPVQKIRVSLLLAINPSTTNLLQGVQKPEDTDPAAINKWVEKLSNDLSFQNLTNATISSVTSKALKRELKRMGDLSFKDLHRMTVQVSVRDSKIAINFGAGLVDGNYQVDLSPGSLEFDVVPPAVKPE